MSHLIPQSRRLLGVLVCCCLTWLPALAVVGQEASEESSRPTFERDVAPILQAHCQHCHGGRVRKAGLDLRRRFSILGGGDSGAAILPSKPERSLLIEMVEDGLMPPEGEKPLTDRQRDVLRQWIKAGAPIAGQEEEPLETSDAEYALSDEDRSFWAFQPPTRPPLPQPKAVDRVRTPIDAFLLAELEEHGLEFNPDADNRVLLRRLCFDLHGLPPTLEQIDEFLRDTRPDAYERLVERLLGSPRYAERWGRHWLDVAGYADSDGYLEADRLRPEAWRYRDYVIHSLNADKPYDQFVMEQLAGDELADWRRAEELTPEMIDKLVATGFLRTASDPTYGNYKEPLECHKVMADTVEIISSALMGLTLQCARCHSHKMEPISQRDYYQVNAILLASYDPQQWLVSAARTVPLASEPQLSAINKTNQAADQSVAKLNQQLSALTEQYRGKHLDQQLAGVAEELRPKVREAVQTVAEKRSAEQKQLVAKHAPDVAIDEAAITKRFDEFRVEAEKLRAAIAAKTALKRDVVQLRGLVDLDDEPRPAHILVRGDFHKLGAKVEPGVPAVLADESFTFQPAPGYKTSGRRKAFADWLVDPRHPLTARVQVNRMWAHHFGRGIVTTVANFGRSGARPSHPELLDWLASEFVDRGWSLKNMHRLMVMSTAYRQTSDLTEEKHAADPDNVLLSRWQPKRHEGEVVRDSMLLAAGRLNFDMHGQPVPVTLKSDGEVVTNDDAAGNRRSVYLIVRRSQPLSLLNLFDTPRMEVNCPQRDQSTVVTQALTMLNSEFTEKAARQVAARVWREADGSDSRIDYVYEILFARRATPTERQFVSDFLAEFVRARLGGDLASATNETKDAAMREGWLHLVQVLLNSNEFVYVH